MSDTRFGLSLGNVDTIQANGKSAPFALPIVDAFDLPEDVRHVLRPWEHIETRSGFVHRLPRFFYEVPSWEAAREIQVTEHFAIWEFIDTDLYEHPLVHSWPRYVPCAVTLLSAQLELLREEAGTYIHVSANGGYRSPAHKLSTHASTHCWATAVNIHRIGNDQLDDTRKIEHYAAIARRVMPGVFIRSSGSGIAEADDHLHIDLGYLEVIPHNVSEAFEIGEEKRKEGGR